MPLLNRQVGDVNCSARSLSKSDLHTLERLKEENQELRKRYLLSFIGHELLMFNMVTMASLCSNLAPCKGASHRLEICAKQRSLLQDQVQLGIEANVQL